ncbi:MAG TPA: hypothetical protein VMF89_29630 [Polyangiales bacterium]|nr:hypothetical protein [Polyangiales bacterium]
MHLTATIRAAAASRPLVVDDAANGGSAPDDADNFLLIIIRDPRITEVGANVEVLARHRGDPMLLRDRNVTCATFYPELSADPRVHAVFGMLTQ